MKLVFTYMLLIGSVRLLSNMRNCLPFLENPLTSAPADTNILSGGNPGVPPLRRRQIDKDKSNGASLPSLRLEIAGPGSVLNTVCEQIMMRGQQYHHYTTTALFSVPC